MFQMSLPKNELQRYVTRQLNHFFPDSQMSGSDALFTRSVDMDLLQQDEAVHNKKIYLEEAVCSSAERCGFRRIRTLSIASNQYLQTIQQLSQAVTGESEESLSLQKLLQKEATYFQLLYNG